MKGVLLCGGEGTRLRPATKIYNKHLALVYDRPMVLYPLQTLKELGVKEILLITGGEHIGDFTQFLGDGSEYGVKLTYKVQKKAGGIADALALAEPFIQERFVTILGDNYFETAPQIPRDCGIVVKTVKDPQRFGVFYKNEITEKPKKPKSNKAVIGIYFYKPNIFKFIRKLKPSKRGELEITDVNNFILKDPRVTITQYKGFWHDMGTPDSLYETASFLKAKSMV